jgi:hypothetical protein
MKVRFSELPVGSCFTGRDGRTVRKKVGDDRVLTVGRGGRVRTRKQKGDPTVSTAGCSLRLIGTGLKKHPETVIEIGDRHPRKRGCRWR